MTALLRFLSPSVALADRNAGRVGRGDLRHITAMAALARVHRDVTRHLTQPPG